MWPFGRNTDPGDELRQDPMIRELITALSLSDRFHFYLVVVQSAAQAGALPDVLAQEIAARHGEPKAMVRIDLAKETVPTLLARLVNPFREEQQACHLLDATGASSVDWDWWSLLFQRMNERRNLISTSLPGSLVLVLPVELEELFARAAPDFWSIRSMVARIAAGSDRGPGADSRTSALPESRSWGQASSVRLASAQFGELARSLAATFSESEMTTLVSGFPAWSESSRGSAADLAIELVRWAERNGRLLELLNRAAKLRPRSRELRYLRDSVEAMTRSSPVRDASRESPTRAEPSDLLEWLVRLLPSQFEEVLFRSNIPFSHLSSASAPQTARAIEVLRYLQSRGDLDRLVRLRADMDGTLR